MKKSRTGSIARETLASPPVATVQVPLPLLAVLADARTAFLGLCLDAGQQVLRTMMEQDREQLCGPKHVPNPHRRAVRDPLRAPLATASPGPVATMGDFGHAERSSHGRPSWNAIAAPCVTRSRATPVLKRQSHGRMFVGPHMVIFTVDKQSSTTFSTASRFPSGFPAETAVHCARLVAAALLLSWAVACADAASDAEMRKIQALLASVERMVPLASQPIDHGAIDRGIALYRVAAAPTA